MKFCAAKKKTGAPCGGKPVAGSEFCAFHDPKRSKVVAAGRQAGGKAATAKPAPDESLKQALPLEKAADVVAIAKDAVNKVRSGVLTPKQGTAIGSLLSAALQGMKRIDDEKEAETDKGERPLKDVTETSIREALVAIEQAAKH
jgi:hypothetical protein